MQAHITVRQITQCGQYTEGFICEACDENGNIITSAERSSAGEAYEAVEARLQIRGISYK